MQYGVKQGRDKRYKMYWYLLAGAVLGALVFVLQYGVSVLDVRNDGWIISYDGDQNQHYIGWKFYRRTPWQFPLGMIEGLGSEPASCIFTDSIPLFAVFFKILSPLLPETFQYFGLWELTCYVLMGALSALLLRKYSGNFLFCLCGSLVYLLTPGFFQRVFTQGALTGHWLIILALLQWVYQDHNWKHKVTPVILWTITGMITILVHMYLFAMVYLVFAGYIITDILRHRKVVRPLFAFCSTTGFSVLMCWIMGGFYGEGSRQASGLGSYSANLNILFNGGNFSKFLKPLNYATKGQVGRTGYLGLGMIVALLLVLLVICNYLATAGNRKFLENLRNTLTKHGAGIVAYVIVMFLTFLIAVSPKVTLNARVLFTIHYPEVILGIMRMFRATGRFVWVADYLVFTAIFAALSKIPVKKTMLCAVLLCTAIQVVDLRDALIKKHNQYIKPASYSSDLKSAEWETLAEGVDEIVFAYVADGKMPSAHISYVFAEYAYAHEMKVNYFNVARPNTERFVAYAKTKVQALVDGTADSHVLYIFRSEKDIPDSVEESEIYVLDNYIAVKKSGPAGE